MVSVNRQGECPRHILEMSAVRETETMRERERWCTWGFMAAGALVSMRPHGNEGGCWVRMSRRTRRTERTERIERRHDRREESGRVASHTEEARRRKFRTQRWVPGSNLHAGWTDVSTRVSTCRHACQGAKATCPRVRVSACLTSMTRVE